MIDSRVCLRRLVSPASRYFLELYEHYKNGVLAVSGGILDQPAVYYRAMLIIDREVRKDGSS